MQYLIRMKQDIWQMIKVSVSGQWADGGSGSCTLLKKIKYIHFEEAGIR